MSCKQKLKKIDCFFHYHKPLLCFRIRYLPRYVSFKNLVQLLDEMTTMSSFMCAIVKLTVFCHVNHQGQRNNTQNILKSFLFL